jgi:Fe-S cluster assembly protein SufD
MRFIDISTDTKNLYTLTENEQVVFFLWNRAGEITFELKGMRAEAHVFAFFVGKSEDQKVLTINQKHLSPHTSSHVLVKSILDDRASFAYRGTIHIAKDAPLSDASQENRNLLLSEEARASSEPTLEILNNDVRCHHAATTSPLNKEQLFFARTRGLSDAQAEELLIQGFLRSSIEKLGKLVSSQDQEKVLALIGKYSA